MSVSSGSNRSSLGSEGALPNSFRHSLLNTRYRAFLRELLVERTIEEDVVAGTQSAPPRVLGIRAPPERDRDFQGIGAQHEVAHRAVQVGSQETPRPPRLRAGQVEADVVVARREPGQVVAHEGP